MSKRSVLQEIAKKHPSLTEAEEKHFLSLSCNGDSSARDKVILHNIGNAINCVHSQFKIAEEGLREEIEDAAVEALIESASRFDSSYNVRLMTYARQNVILYAWNALIHARTNHTIKLHIYKKVAKWIKEHPQHADSDGVNAVMKMMTCSEFVAAQVFSIVKNGVSNISALINSEAFEGEDGEGGYGYLQDVGTSVTTPHDELDTRLMIQMQEIALRVEGFCERNLTNKQLSMFKTVIIPFLREARVVTLKEAADILHCRYQNVDQTFEYMKVKLTNSREGRVVSYIIDCVLAQVKIKRTNSKVMPTGENIRIASKKIVDRYTESLAIPDIPSVPTYQSPPVPTEEAEVETEEAEVESPTADELAELRIMAENTYKDCRMYLTPKQFRVYEVLIHPYLSGEGTQLTIQEVADKFSLSYQAISQTMDAMILTLERYNEKGKRLQHIITTTSASIVRKTEKKDISSSEQKANKIIALCVASLRTRSKD